MNFFRSNPKTAAVFVGLTLIAWPAEGDSATNPAPLLPSPREIVARHLAQAGGTNVLERHGSIRLTGNITHLGAGFSAPAEFLIARPGKFKGRVFYHHKFFGKLKVPLIGKVNFECGYDGKNSWFIDPRIQTGPTRLERQNLALFLSLFDLHSPLYAQRKAVWEKSLEIAEFGGRSCYRIIFVPPGTDPLVEYYDVATGLRAGGIYPYESPSGSINVLVEFAGYKAFGDLTFPTLLKARAAEDEYQITLTAAKFDPILNGEFTPPSQLPADSLQVKSPRGTKHPLPPAGDIIARYVQALGGRESIVKYGSVRLRGTYELPHAKLQLGDAEIIKAKPDRVLVKITLPGWGVYRHGYDGKTFWRIRPDGQTIFHGKELNQRLQDAAFHSELHENVNSRWHETLQIVSFGGSECYQVLGLRSDGELRLEFFDCDTGLLAGCRFADASEGGAINVTRKFAHYKKFGERLLPTQEINLKGRSEEIFTVKSVEFDQVPDSVFAVPTELQLARLKDGAR